jgi:tetratricopeptide (TPR) repeat protein
MSHFPIEWHEQDLFSTDFVHFEHQFSQTVLRYIPFASGPVSFISFDKKGNPIDDHQTHPKYWTQYAKRVVKKKNPVVAVVRKILFLPVWIKDVIIAVAVVRKIDETFVKSLSVEWLSDRSRIISREFFLLKQLAVDPVTGLLNSRDLFDKIESLIDEASFQHSALQKKVTSIKDFADGPPHFCSLFLIEMYPRVNDAEKALNYISKAGYYLNSCLGQSVIHHLGNGLFGLIIQDINEDKSQKLGKNILNWIRRENYNRAHIGIASLDIKNVQNIAVSEVLTPTTLLNEAWQALRRATRRGPYALCTYNSISNPEKHPLHRPSASAMAKFRQLWKEEETFAILLLKQDSDDINKSFTKRALVLIEANAHAVKINEQETFVFLPGADEKAALKWARSFKKKLPSENPITFSTGIAVHPCIDFKKTDIPHNAQKALLHTAFYGSNTITAFDGLSLNVSGDIYYGEGDLVQAVREYRKGLDLSPADTNLLNSLGETYAQMNKPRLAKLFFEKALHSDPHQYMALFNLGLANLAIGEEELSIKCFEKALKVAKRKPEINNRNDLLLQLGKLYCRAGKYKKAVNLLENSNLAERENSKGLAAGTVLRYLGEAYQGVGKNKKAVTVLQHAIGYNPHDAVSLSMLGELYALEEQGDDIALSLCEQAVEIDDVPWIHWYRLAWIKFRLNEFAAAKDAVKESLRRNNKSVQALYLAGMIYNAMDKKHLAVAKFEKVISLEPAHKDAVAELLKIKKKKKLVR